MLNLIFWSGFYLLGFLKEDFYRMEAKSPKKFSANA